MPSQPVQTSSDRQRYSRRVIVAGIGAGILLGGGFNLRAGDELPETDPTGEGPFYKAGAPERADIVDKGMAGVPLLLTGSVRDSRGHAVAGAVLDLWQADMSGTYDNEGYRLRGRLQAGKDGRYKVRCLVPKAYSTGGGGMRAAHIHIKVSASAHRLVTTELYVKGDSHNYDDFGVRPSLQMALADNGRDGKLGSFDFVLRHA